jgi:hypothetical protein
MSTTTKLTIAALLLAFSASGALAQYASPGPTYGVEYHKAAPRHSGAQTYGNEVPFAPF